MEEINLIENLNKKNKNNKLNITKILPEDEEKDKSIEEKVESMLSKISHKDYNKYIDLFKSYLKDSNNKTQKLKFRFYINENGDYVKEPYESLDKDAKDTMVLRKPSYINISDRIRSINNNIKSLEYNLKSYRDQLINNNLENKEEFNRLRGEYYKLDNERDILIRCYNKLNNIEQDKNNIEEYRKSIIDINLKQYELNHRINETNESHDFSLKNDLINEYILNNKAISNTLKNINTIKSKEYTDFLIGELYENNTKCVKKKLFKTKKTIGECISKPEKKVKKSKEKKENNEKDEKENNEKDEIKDNNEKDEIKDNNENKELEEIDLESLDLTNELKTLETPMSGKNMDIEELNLGDDLEELQSEFDMDMGSDSGEMDDNYVFNSKSTKKELTEDSNIPIEFEKTDDTDKTDKTGKNEDLDLFKKMKEPIKNKKSEVSDDINIDKLSRQLNKKVKDPNIKIIKVDPNLQFSNIKFNNCDDSKTKRSDINTTDMAEGKKRRKKNMDKELKNCIFPFKEEVGQGKGKKKKIVVSNECVVRPDGEICATERNPDCTTKKWAYCKK